MTQTQNEKLGRDTEMPQPSPFKTLVKKLGDQSWEEVVEDIKAGQNTKGQDKSEQ